VLPASAARRGGATIRPFPPARQEEPETQLAHRIGVTAGGGPPYGPLRQGITARVLVYFSVELALR
jgi:hypothetical protein